MILRHGACYVAAPGLVLLISHVWLFVTNTIQIALAQ